MNALDRLKTLVERSDTRGGRIFDFSIQGLIVLCLITFAIETLPDLSPFTIGLLWYIEVVSISVFTAEYLLRLFFADRRLQFIFSFFGIIDLLAILPFYLSIGIDLRSLRALRLLRLVRVLKLVRFSRAIRRFHRAFMIAREELALFLFATCIVLYLAAVGIYYFENAAQPEQFKSVFHSLWWAVITLTTVGYGDVYPITAGGRVFTFVVLMIGLGIISVPAGLVASALSKARQEEDEEFKRKQVKTGNRSVAKTKSDGKDSRQPHSPD